MSDIRVRYRGADQSLPVRLIKTWKRGEIDHQTMSTSGGPKDTFVNQIFEVFSADPGVDAVSMVRGGGPQFLIYRKGPLYFDMAHKEVEVLQVRPADSEVKV
jgi:hypothetical protein